MRKKWLVVTLCLLQISLWSLPTAYGSDLCRICGEKEAVIISTVEELRNMKSGMCYRLGNDIAVGKWERITTFKGHLDGDGYRLQNADIYTNANAKIGFWEQLERGAVICNVIFENPRLALKQTPIPSGSNIGLVTGYNLGKIENCYILNGHLSSERINDCFVGSLAGKNNGTIQNCLVDGEIALNTPATTPVAGGKTVRDCFTTIDVTSEATDGSKFLNGGNAEETLSQFNQQFSSGIWHWQEGKLLLLPFSVLELEAFSLAVNEELRTVNFDDNNDFNLGEITTGSQIAISATVAGMVKSTAALNGELLENNGQQWRITLTNTGAQKIVLTNTLNGVSEIYTISLTAIAPPIPDPEPTPTPEEKPEPNPEPTPNPEEKPEPNPEPTPTPEEKPKPTPNPEEKPDPAPEEKPQPDPKPEVKPEPDEETKPEPKPTPDNSGNSFAFINEEETPKKAQDILEKHLAEPYFMLNGAIKISAKLTPELAAIVSSNAPAVNPLAERQYAVNVPEAVSKLEIPLNVYLPVAGAWRAVDQHGQFLPAKMVVLDGKVYQQVICLGSEIVTLLPMKEPVIVDHWAAEPFCRASAMGLIDKKVVLDAPISYGEFQRLLNGQRAFSAWEQEQALSRQEAMVLLQHKGQLTAIAEGAAIPVTFSDWEEVAESCREGVLYCLHNGLIVGDGDSLKPNAPLTNGEAVAIIIRFLQKADWI